MDATTTAPKVLALRAAAHVGRNSSSSPLQGSGNGLESQSDYSAARTSSLNRKPKAAANSFATSIPTLTLPNSIELIYVRWTLALSAKSSWERPSLCLSFRTAAPNVRLENFVALGTPYS